MAETLGGPAPPDVRHPPASVRDAPEHWRLWLPEGVESGVHAETPGDASGLLHAGENWAGREYTIDTHTHTGWELYVQLHGASSWRFADRELRLAPGWLVAVPPGMPHRTVPRPRDGVRHHYAYAAIDLAVVGRRSPEIARAWPRAGVHLSPDARTVAAAFRAVVREVAEDRPWGAVALAAAVDLLAVEALRALTAGEAARSRVARHPAVVRARHLLDEQYAAPWRLPDLAAACAVSRTRLAELFTAEVGQPPYAYLLERRVERAADLLATTGHSVARIAAEVGFSSPAQLSRTFRQLWGCTPTQWRRRARPR